MAKFQKLHYIWHLVWDIIFFFSQTPFLVHEKGQNLPTLVLGENKIRIKEPSVPIISKTSKKPHFMKEPVKNQWL
jgi:hypothetical protein